MWSGHPKNVLSSALRSTASTALTASTVVYWVYPALLQAASWTVVLTSSLLYLFTTVLFSSLLYSLVSRTVAAAGT